MTTPTPARPPLWRVMQEAADRSCCSDLNRSNARIILAVRDWLLPEEVAPLGPAGTQNMYLRDLLAAEVERAERGDG